MWRKRGAFQDCISVSHRGTVGAALVIIGNSVKKCCLVSIFPGIFLIPIGVPICKSNELGYDGKQYSC